MPTSTSTSSQSAKTRPTVGEARPTIKDVARVAGVHFTTVSMALRGNPRIPAATRARVAAAAATLGYERNEVYFALSRRRQSCEGPAFTPTIAYVTNQSVENGLLKTAHQRRLLRAARAQAKALGYGFKLLAVDAGAHDSASLLRHLREQHIHGLILATMQPDRAPLELPWRDFRIVRIDSRHVTSHGSFVSTDQWQCVRLAHRELRKLGYQRVGLAVGHTDESGTGGLHQAAWLLEQQALPQGARSPVLLFPPGTDYRSIVPLLRAWIDAHRIDAVICNWSNIRSLLRTAGFAVPQRIACACLCLAQPLPALAGVVTHLDRVAKDATTLLIHALRSDAQEPPPTLTYVEGTWHPGSSAPPRR